MDLGDWVEQWIREVPIAVNRSQQSAVELVIGLGRQPGEEGVYTSPFLTIDLHSEAAEAAYHLIQSGIYNFPEFRSYTNGVAHGQLEQDPTTDKMMTFFQLRYLRTEAIFELAVKRVQLMREYAMQLDTMLIKQGTLTPRFMLPLSKEPGYLSAEPEPEPSLPDPLADRSLTLFDEWMNTRPPEAYLVLLGNRAVIDERIQ